MQDILHKILYAGIGLAAMSEQKAQEIVAELQKRGEVSAEDGKKLAQELVDKARQHTQEIRRFVSQEVEKVSGKIKIVSREEFDALERRVAALEKCCSTSQNNDDTL